jgi:hypothetical protein
MSSVNDLKAKIDNLDPHELSGLENWLAERERWKKGDLRDCFVIMPFAETREGRNETYWLNFFEHFLKPALEKCGYRARRSKADPENIVGKIMEDLAWTNIVLAVLTDSNANVWYELGVRHSLRKGTVMICQAGQEIAFDLKHHGVVFYESALNAESLTLKLKDHLTKAEKDEAEDSPVSNFLSSGLVYCINKALSGKREALEALKRELELDKSGKTALEVVIKINDEWRPRDMQLTVVKNDKILKHRGEVHEGTAADLCWKDMTVNNQSLYPAMKQSGKGFRVGSIEHLHGRITAIAYDTLSEQEWLVVAEAHLRQGQL